MTGVETLALVALIFTAAWAMHCINALVATAETEAEAWQEPDDPRPVGEWLDERAETRRRAARRVLRASALFLGVVATFQAIEGYWVGAISVGGYALVQLALAYTLDRLGGFFS